MTADDLAKSSETPALAPDFVGVQVALSPAHAQRGPLDLVGAFQLRAEQAEAIDAHPHRALIVVLSSAQGASAVAPFLQRTFFPDDVHRDKAMVRGFFRVRLVPEDRELPQGPQWVTASMGEQISNAVAINEEPPAPLAP